MTPKKQCNRLHLDVKPCALIVELPVIVQVLSIDKGKMRTFVA